MLMGSDLPILTQFLVRRAYTLRFADQEHTEVTNERKNRADFVYVGRSRSLAEYRRVAGRLEARARAVNATRQLRELRWFARNIAIKLALVAHARRAAARLGHEPGAEWPY